MKEKRVKKLKTYERNFKDTVTGERHEEKGKGEEKYKKTNIEQHNQVQPTQPH